MGGWWRWALVSPDGVAPSRMVSVSAFVNLPLHHIVQKFSSGTGSPGWSQKKGPKTTASTAAKLCTMTKTTKFCSWVVKIYTKQIQVADGRHLEKLEVWYLCNGLPICTNFITVMHLGPPDPISQQNFQILKSSRWWKIAIYVHT